jgi:hypothetical protein
MYSSMVGGGLEAHGGAMPIETPRCLALSSGRRCAEHKSVELW